MRSAVEARWAGGLLRLDERDVAILGALSRDGRMTKARLAETVNLSPSPCWERLHRLEAAGLIASYRAEVDLDRIVSTVRVLVEVELGGHRAEDFQTFEDALAAVPEVIECWATGGGIDYIMMVLARDIDAYQRLMDRLLIAEIGIRRYFTYVVTKRVKSTPPDLENLLKDAL